MNVLEKGNRHKCDVAVKHFVVRLIHVTFVRQNKHCSAQDIEFTRFEIIRGVREARANQSHTQANIVRLRQHWRDDQFTFEAVRAALNTLLDALSPKGELRAPQSVIDYADDRAAPTAWREAENFGFAVAARWLFRLERRELPPKGLPDGVSYPDEFYLLPRLRRELDIKRNK